MSAAQSDSINHNFDQIILLLGPEVDVTIADTQLQWGLNLSHAIPQVVLVGWLNGPITMPSDVAATLSQYGITAQDYPQILSADPFASDSTGQGKPAAARFAYLTVLPYEPVSGQYTWKTGNNYTASTTDTANVSYSVGATASASAAGIVGMQ